MQIGDILNKRPQQFSIDKLSVNTSKLSIELPEVIDSLIDNKAYRNRYKKLIREGHLQRLLQLAEYAATKDKPSHWFARACSVKSWESTLQWLKKAIEIARNAAEVARRLAAKASDMKAIYKAAWRFKSAVIAKAVLAEEIVNEKGGNKLRLFNYLCWKT
jgi:pyruvate-formate lyase-activating enzyme